MFCLKCGELIPDDYTYCPKCGEEMIKNSCSGVETQAQSNENNYPVSDEGKELKASGAETSTSVMEPPTSEKKSAALASSTPEPKSSPRMEQTMIKVTEKKNRFKGLAIISFLVSAAMLILGFYKMFAYNSGEYYPYEYVNAYVGGDAYNFIINGTYSTAFFVLATGFLLCGFCLLIYGELKLQRNNK